MTVTFLLGSGVSRDAGFPGVWDITEQVRSGDGAWRHTDGTYIIDATNPNCGLWRHRVEPVLSLLAEVGRRIEAAAISPEITYEDMALVVQQVRDALRREYESVAVLPLTAELAESLGVDEDGLATLCDEAEAYIQDTVVACLGRGDLRQHAHLGAIVDACRDLQRVDLATLNHDLLLEGALTSGCVNYVDGFTEASNGVGLWADEWTERVRLLKLHGSIDWFDVRAADVSSGWTAARCRGVDIEHLPSRLVVRSPRPTFLTGTFTKILAYQTGIFPEVHTRFHEGLRTASRLVVIGYGFRDKAINSHVITWMARRTTNALVVCHPDPPAAASAARPAVQRAWAEWLGTGRLRTIPVAVDALSYADLAAALDH